MGIAEGMKSMTEDIIASYDMRIKAQDDLVTNTRKTLKRFAQERKKTSEEQTKDLVNFVGNLSKGVGNMLKGFQNDRITMSERLKNRLAKERKEIKPYVKEMVSSVRNLLGEYRSDIRKASAAWKGMATTLARARKKGVMARSEAGEKVTTVEEAAKKEGMSRIEAGKKMTAFEETMKKGKEKKKNKENRWA